MDLMSLVPALMASSPVKDQSSLDSLGYVAGVFGIMALLYSYQLISTRNGLDAQIAKRNAMIRKLDEDIKMKQDVATAHKGAEVPLDGRVAEEVKKLEAASKTEDHNGMPKGYWDRLQQMDSISPKKTDEKA
jgi:hypothetical protein